jgi:hypothetical protein
LIAAMKKEPQEAQEAQKVRKFCASCASCGSFFLFCAALIALLLILSPFARAEDAPPLDLRSIPISDWLNAGNHAEVPWDIRVRPPYLRIDQRLEVSYSARISSKDLNRSGDDHELFLVSRISSPEGEWLNEPRIVRHMLSGELANHLDLQFLMRVVVQPGDYVLWITLYDRKTGKHNVAKRRLRVSELRGDPLPDLYRRMPLVEFPDISDSDKEDLGFLTGQLNLPVRNKHPLQVELISMLSPPEQWTGRSRIVRVHNDDTIGALSALSQLDLAEGSLSITGLDLVRRQVIFEQRELDNLQWTSFVQAMKKAQSPDVSTKDLQESKNNGAFFREILNRRITAPSSETEGMRVMIVVTSARMFESGSDLRPLQVEGDCNCRVYYLRFRLNVNDVFDQLEKLMKPLRPRVFNLISPRDLRKAIAQIVDDLAKF